MKCDNVIGNVGNADLLYSYDTELRLSIIQNVVDSKYGVTDLIIIYRHLSELVGTGPTSDK